MLSLEQHHLSLPWSGGDHSLLRLTSRNCHSPSDASFTFLWRPIRHASACSSLCLPSSPGQRVQTPSTELSSCRTWWESALCSHGNISARREGRIKPQASLKSQEYILVSEHHFMPLTQFDGRVRHLSKASNDLSKALYDRE